MCVFLMVIIDINIQVSIVYLENGWHLVWGKIISWEHFSCINTWSAAALLPLALVKLIRKCSPGGLRNIMSARLQRLTGKVAELTSQLDIKSEYLFKASKVCWLNCKVLPSSFASQYIAVCYYIWVTLLRDCDFNPVKFPTFIWIRSRLLFLIWLEWINYVFNLRILFEFHFFITIFYNLNTSSCPHCHVLSDDVTHICLKNARSLWP